jgi:DNA-directed RNA polymerase specialized sigma subunit
MVDPEHEHHSNCEPDRRKIIKALEAMRQQQFQGLTRAEKLIIILFLYEQMTFKEIGLTLDLSEENTQSMYRKSILNLLT